jgi:hypothetical protein
MREVNKKFVAKRDLTFKKMWIIISINIAIEEGL